MNKALQALKEGNPTLYTQFIDLLTEDLGLHIESSAGNLKCPNCQTQFQVTLNEPSVPRGRKRQSKNEPPSRGRRQLRRWNLKPNSLFNLLVRMAKLRRTTTGGVSAEFNKTMRSKIKGLTPAEIREVKIKWLTEQLAKGKSKAKVA